tara:strand:+ start:659 stop:898 length:240 start_codon:yes stop_codon:yes gene_type:complete
VKYTFENLILDMDNSARAKLYVSGRLAFVGDGYVALQMFIRESGNHPAVIKKFKSQLEMREKHKWKEPKSDGTNRMESN